MPIIKGARTWWLDAPLIEHAKPLIFGLRRHYGRNARRSLSDIRASTAACGGGLRWRDGNHQACGMMSGAMRHDSYHLLKSILYHRHEACRSHQPAD